MFGDLRGRNLSATGMKLSPQRPSNLVETRFITSLWAIYRIKNRSDGTLAVPIIIAWDNRRGETTIDSKFYGDDRSVVPPIDQWHFGATRASPLLIGRQNEGCCLLTLCAVIEDAGSLGWGRILREL